MILQIMRISIHEWSKEVCPSAFGDKQNLNRVETKGSSVFG